MKNIKSILFDEPAVVDNFSSWPQKKKMLVKKENTLDWKQRDFSIYIREKFAEKFSRNCSISTIGITTYLGNIKVKVKDRIGFCDNNILKRYIDFFYDKYIELYVDREIPWIFNMKSDFILSDFAKNYNDNQEIVIEDKKSMNVKLKDIENCYILGLKSVIREYGVLVAINYLKIINKLNDIVTYEKVAKSLLELSEDGCDVTYLISKKIEIENQVEKNLDNFMKFWISYKEIYEGR